MSDPTLLLARLLSLGCGLVVGLIAYALFPDQLLAILSGLMAALISYLYLLTGGDR